MCTNPNPACPQELTRKGEFVRMGVLVVESEKTHARAVEAYERNCMPGEDNLVLNGQAGPTLEGIVLDEEDGRLLHVGQGIGGRKPAQPLPLDACMPFWCTPRRSSCPPKPQGCTPCPMQDDALFAITVAGLLQPMRTSVVTSLLHPSKWQDAKCDKDHCR